MGASCRPTRRFSIHPVLLAPGGLRFRLLATREPRGSRLIVGDPANGDSILAFFLGINNGVCDDGGLRHVDPWTIIGGTGRYAGARGHFTTDQCSNLDTGETGGTIRGTIIVR